MKKALKALGLDILTGIVACYTAFYVMLWIITTVR